MGVIRFVLALGFAFVLVSFASIAWPLISDSPRPQALEDIKDAALQTEIGAQTAVVLGVADESTSSATTFAEIGISAKTSLVESVQKQARHFVMTKALQTILTSYHELPESEQKMIQQYLCVPQESSTEATGSAQL